MRFTELESGRKADRPKLVHTLHHTKVTGATLVIAKLDYPSRNAAFLLALRDSGEKVVPFDMLVPNDLTVGFMALVAEAGRDSISWRTKVSLASVNARGVKLGKPNGAESLKRARKGGAALQAVVGVKADQFARD